MDKTKWLLKEIDTWKSEALIDETTAGTLKERYLPKKNYNILLVMFSIIGSLLIGAGIILIGAKNWYSFPIFIRTAIGLFPLLLSQGLTIYVVMRRQQSLAWREAVAIFNTAANFAAIAMISQIFHVYNDFNTYVVICGLLSLPMIFILDAASPLIIYYATVMTFGAMSEHTLLNLIIMLLLFAAGAAYPFFKRKTINSRLIYLSWITVIAATAAVVITAIITETYIWLIGLSFFTMLMAFDGIPEKVVTPFKIIGTLGAIVTLFSIALEEGGNYYYSYFTDSDIYISGYIFTGLFLIVSIYFTVKTFAKDKLKFAFLLSLIIMTVLIYVESFNIFMPFDAVFYLPNILLLLIGAGYILHGSRHMNLITANTGLAIICALLLYWFFLIDIDFLWRGIVFFAIGAGFLIANLRIVRSKKKAGKGES